MTRTVNGTGQICKKIHRGGNAEQYNADKKYKEAVAVAAEKPSYSSRRAISRSRIDGLDALKRP